MSQSHVPIDKAGDKTAPGPDSRALRRCLGQFATGVTVLTSQVGDVRIGVTANSFSSLSLDPPLVLWSIGRTSRSFDAFQDATHFTVNILKDDQIGISQRFSSSASDKFSGIAWAPGRTGMPVIEGILAFLECRCVARHDAGDHVLIIGQVEHFDQFEGRPLVFVQGNYGIADDHPEVRGNRISVSDAGKPLWRYAPIMRLLSMAYHTLHTRFEKYRNAEGLTLAHARILVGVYERPGITIDALMLLMYVGRREAEEAICDLIGRSFLERDSSGRLTLTASGRERREAIGSRTEKFEAEQLTDLSKAEVEAGRRFLARLADSPLEF